ncbi:FmdE family protein [Arcobacter sp. LA11]|uniref:FmdE family protein n=1 Tax=Arcobacter sp. LA11 TaxID=1898176 RepID=UPI0009355D04|nr:FmdE family protein [Arcobacter sp. LA11]
MNYPDFFNTIEKIKLKDDLSNFLGATEDGIIEFSYIDVVKTAGHSCPTVLGAYLMTLEGLKALYKDELPKRGEIKIEYSEKIEDGVAGVIANVMTNITGATVNTGFKGIMGLFSRNSLMAFESDINSSVRFTRRDTNESVDVIYDPSSIGASPMMRELMQKSISRTATAEEEKEFGKLWQQRVEAISQNIQEVIKIV